MINYLAELPIILWWYVIIFGIGIIFFPATRLLFSNFTDKGYAFSKILGLAFISYIVWFLSSAYIIPFSYLSILIVVGLSIVVNLYLLGNIGKAVSNIKKKSNRESVRTILLEEALFLFGYLAWVYVRGHEPSIYGLEKFMDFGFINSILQTSYFPPQDMWLAPEVNPGSYQGGFSINYYYFGHYVTALLTKLTMIPSYITYNLMLSAIFGLTLSGAFSIGYNIVSSLVKKAKNNILPTIAGLLSGWLTTVAGNLHTIYIFTKGYQNENPVPFWNIWGPNIDQKTGEFITDYWYPNATRFIPNTIHEFPSYSWVVADLHGHVLDIPFVLLTIGVLFSLLLTAGRMKNIRAISYTTILLGLLSAIMYMTNAWDGLIYIGISSLSLFIVSAVVSKKSADLIERFINWKSIQWLVILGVSFFVFTFPFNLNFVPFVHGVGIVGGYEFFDQIGIIDKFPAQTLAEGGTNEDVRTLGPLLFEKGNNLRSPIWMLSMLWGFFYMNLILLTKITLHHMRLKTNWLYILLTSSLVLYAIAFTVEAVSIGQSGTTSPAKFMSIPAAYLSFIALVLFLIVIAVMIIKNIKTSASYTFLFLISIIAVGLTVVPELLYAKDIYPAHYRANTMFKLGYQAYILFSIMSGCAIVLFTAYVKSKVKTTSQKLKRYGVLSILVIATGLVLVYPYFAINSYYGVFKSVNSGGLRYQTIDGTGWLMESRPDDYNAINWLKDQEPAVILEAVGESYTDYARISTYTGYPTVLGWPVHEWLWRGSYDEPGTRIEEVRKIYEGTDRSKVLSLIEQFNIEYIVIGKLEHDKYPDLNEELLASLGEKMFQSGSTSIYKVD